MKIVNNTDLSYSTLGLIIDNILEKSSGNTNYYGKIEWTTFKIANRKIKLQIRYLRKITEWRFDYVEDKS